MFNSDQKANNRLALPSIIQFVKLLRIDVFMGLVVLAHTIPGMALNKLVQDKYCISDLEASPDLCLNLEKLGPEYKDLKDEVLKFSVQIGLYNTYTSTMPQLLYGLFLGYWLDKHPGHLRYLMAAPILTGAVGTSITIYHILNFETKAINLLWTVVPNLFSGGFSTLVVGCYTYLARRTPARFRSARYGVIHFFSVVPGCLASPLGTWLLYEKPWLGVYRNYFGVEICCLVLSLTSGLWVVIMLYDAGYPPVGDDTSQTKGSDPEEPSEGMRTFDTNQDKAIPSHETMQSKPTEGNSGIFHHVTEVFSSLGRIFTKQRPFNRRIVLVLAMLSLILITIDNAGENVVDYQFTQKVYHWDAREYSAMASAQKLLTSVCMLFLPGLLVNTLGIQDIRIAVAASSSLIISSILKGSVMDPWAYIASGVIMIPTGLIRISLQSVVSRLVEPSELARIFAFFGIADVLTATLARTIYTNIFEATISYAPWAYHFVTSAMVMIPFLIFLGLDCTRGSWDPEDIKSTDLNICPTIRPENVDKAVVIDNKV